MADLAIVSAGKRHGPFRGKGIACIYVNSACMEATVIIN